MAPNPAVILAEFAERLAEASFVRFPMLGHFGPLQCPELVADDALAWWATTG